MRSTMLAGAACGLLLAACGDDAPGTLDHGAPNQGSGGTQTISISGGTSSGGTSSGGTGSLTLPSDFTPAEQGSGYKLGDPVTSGSMPPNPGACNNTITGYVRDFKARGTDGGHPNFEMTLRGLNILPGIVETMLGGDRKPVFSGLMSDYTTNAADFDEWYNTTPDINLPFYLTLFLAPGADGIYSFQSHAFFPLDGEGFGNQSNQHNYHFTSEFHTAFTYHGGEVFKFIGDDDVWVFINHRLAVDLGGVHGEQTGQTSLDTDASKLGITKGQSYDLDFFHAERHTTESNFRVDTTIDFTNCGVFVPDKPPK